MLGEYITVENKPDSEIECVIAVHNDDYFLDITDYEHKTNKPWRSETLQWEVFVFRKENADIAPPIRPIRTWICSIRRLRVLSCGIRTKNIKNTFPINGEK